MKKSILAAALFAAFAAPTALVQSAIAEEAAAPVAEHTFTPNVGVVSDYLFRGISQSHGKPALQGGVDYAHSSGLYAGIWGSTIQWVTDAQNKSVPLEIDVYGGYKNTFAGGDWNYDVGVITYNYPGSRDYAPSGSAKANTTEVYGALGYKWLSAKYSYATSSHFIGWYGGPAGGDLSKNTRGSDYLELNANYDLGNGWAVLGHVGHQKVKNYVAVGDTDASYNDWKLGVTKDVGFGVVGLAYSDTDSKGNCPANAAGTNTNAYCWGTGGNTANYRDASKAQAVLSFNKTF
jgi:uncharacterized protein (TIGR02001 family)